MISAAFQFYVGLNCGIVTEMDIRAGVNAGFYHEADAIKWAKLSHDGLNFVMIYNRQGKTVHLFGPQSKVK